MIHRFHYGLACLLIAAFFCGACNSGGPRQEEPESTGGPFREELESLLAELDHNRDGAISLDELTEEEREEIEPNFGAVDANDDGLVTIDELATFFENDFEEATFEVEGDVAWMEGVIGPSTPDRVRELIGENPSVTRIIMTDVPGSMDDESNLRAARIVRAHGIATHVPADGAVASGGTDFFLAGAMRTAELGARFGVHSWGGPGFSGADVPRDDPEHEKYLRFYRDMGIPTGFYWYTLEAASADSIHWMTQSELEQYSMLTSEIAQAEKRGRRSGRGDYGLNSVDVASGSRGIVPLPSSVNSILRKLFDRYARVVAPNGEPIHILVQPEWTEDQVVHVRNVLQHFLTDAPGTFLGKDKTAVANAMAKRRATMVLFNDVDAMEAAFDGSLGRINLAMQDLRANECTPPGSSDYLKHETRDATYEEVLHLVHDYGIRPALPQYDALLEQGNLLAAENDLWDPWPRDEPDSHRNEYIAAVYDNYLDLWTVAPTRYEGESLSPRDIPKGTSHFGAYRAGSRASLAELDPTGLTLVEQFFPGGLTFVAELPDEFSGTFRMSLDEAHRYTMKSQHLRHVKLRGDKDASLVGNQHDNKLRGNHGANRLRGEGGDDRLSGGGGIDVAVFRGARAEYEIRRRGDGFLVTDSRPDRDGTDRLNGVERVCFSDTGDLDLLDAVD